MSSSAPIRAIVARFSFPFSQQMLEKVLVERPFEFCAGISQGPTPHFFEGVPRVQQEWFDSGNTRGAEYEGVDWSDIAPLDEALIEHMRGCEAVFMDLMGRLEWRRRISYNDRKHRYYKHLRFWNDYLTRHRINLFLSAWIPHEMPDIIIYFLCKERGIPVLYFRGSTERDAAFAEHDLTESAASLGARFEELRKEYAGKTDLSLITLEPRFDERFRALTAPAGEKPALEAATIPTYVDKVRRFAFEKPLGFLTHALSYFTPRGIVRALGAWNRLRVIRKRTAFYDAHAIEPDLTRPYVYFALHFQPEATTTPMGGAFEDQRLIARLLRAHLPKDVLIYIKEHPRESSWLYRSAEYYEELLAIPNVRLIKRNVDTFTLREHSRAVATVTGSVGYEAIFRGKPVFMFGHSFYQYAPGVFRIHSSEDCANAVRSIFTEHAAPSLFEARLFLRAMQETCVPANLHDKEAEITKLSEQERLERCSEVIRTEIDLLAEEIASVR